MNFALVEENVALAQFLKWNGIVEWNPAVPIRQQFSISNQLISIGLFFFNTNCFSC
jgi:hypothetical protein